MTPLNGFPLRWVFVERTHWGDVYQLYSASPVTGGLPIVELRPGPSLWRLHPLKPLRRVLHEKPHAPLAVHELRAPREAVMAHVESLVRRLF